MCTLVETISDLHQKEGLQKGARGYLLRPWIPSMVMVIPASLRLIGELWIHSLNEVGEPSSLRGKKNHNPSPAHDHVSIQRVHGEESLCTHTPLSGRRWRRERGWINGLHAARHEIWFYPFKRIVTTRETRSTANAAVSWTDKAILIKNDPPK